MPYHASTEKLWCLHNRLRDVLLKSCRLACLGPQVEAGSGLGHEGHTTRPADILIPHWDLGKPAALDLTVTLNYTKFKYVNGSGCDKWICSSGS